MLLLLHILHEFVKFLQISVVIIDILERYIIERDFIVFSDYINEVSFRNFGNFNSSFSLYPKNTHVYKLVQCSNHLPDEVTKI